jgi:biotin transport system substrate-specific component
MNIANKHKTWHELIFRETSILLDMALVLVSVGLLAVFANIRIPLWPVPVTLQTFGVFLIAFFFGARKGALTMAAYLLAGISGVAVFTGYKSGMAALIGPTGGYIIGFIFMAFFIGLMIEKGFGRTVKSVLICMLVGEIILYICGLTGLWFYLGDVSFLKVLELGFFPFVIGDVLKIAAAAALFPLMWKGCEKIKE